MEVVSFDGKEYVKGSVVAERFRYTADYLGQLCRGKKVDARLIGRAWYVNVDSLNAHRDTRYKTAEKEQGSTKVGINVVKETPNHYLSRIDVEPIVKRKTVSLYQQHKGTLLETKVKYEIDEYSLIPRINKEAVSQRLPITPAEAEELEISATEGKSVRFKPEVLPEVYLHGRLKVSDASDIEEPQESQPEITAAEAEVDLKIEPETKPERLAPQVAAVPSRTVKVRSKNRNAVFQNTHQPVPQKPIVVAPAPQAVSKRAGTASVSTPISIIHPNETEFSAPKPISIATTPVKPFKTAPIALERPQPLVAATSRTPSVATLQRPRQAEGVRVASVAAQNPSSLVVASFKPSAVLKKEVKKKQVATQAGWALPVSIFLFGCVVGTALLGVQSDVMASTKSSAEHFFFSTDQLEAALSFVSFK